MLYMCRLTCFVNDIKNVLVTDIPDCRGIYSVFPFVDLQVVQRQAQKIQL